ncbi:helix-turn-helix transcriptional regulator [Sphingomonas sp. GB1N7]|uniref:helix-turn-helix transcriptional regulator n=1 Tax=Parasphingomonas caseinilytica TaxID=3096158 RepID=UPI002FCA07EA
MMTVAQCRAARALLDWTAQDLADRANIGVATIRRYETGAAIAEVSHDAIELALKKAGVVFITAGSASATGGDGVRLVGMQS